MLKSWQIDNTIRANILDTFARAALVSLPTRGAYINTGTGTMLIKEFTYGKICKDECMILVPEVKITNASN